MHDFLTSHKTEVTLALIAALLALLLSKIVPALWKNAADYVLLIIKRHTFERHYVRWLVNECQYLPSLPSQIVQPEGLPKQVELGQMFIRLRMRKGEEKTKELSISGLVNPGTRTVILGDPGAGKTTLLRYLCLVFSKRRALRLWKIKKRRELLRNLEAKHVLIPIHFFLNRWATVGEDETMSLLEAVRHSLPESLRSSCPSNYFERLLESGRALVLLDGLDEITSFSARARAAKEIGSLASASHEDTVWIVTSRVIGYPTTLYDYNFSVAIVEDLTQKQVRQFISDWYRRKCEMADFPQGQLKREQEVYAARARHLVDTVESNPGLRSLARNPMLVSLIALLHSLRLELPENRALLYRECVEILLERWDLSRGIRGEDTLTLNARQKTDLLGAVAWEMHNAQKKEITETEFEELLSDALKQMVNDTDLQKSQTLVRALEERSGLVISRGISRSGEKILAFSNLSFQEFLVASGLVNRPKDEARQFLVARFKDSWWREPILLYVAQLDRPQELIQEIYDRAKRDASTYDLLLAGSCLAEISIEKSDQLYAHAFQDLAFLFSCGKLRTFNLELLRHDRYNLLLRCLVTTLLEVYERQPLGLEYLYKRRSSVSGLETLAEKCVDVLASSGELPRFETNLLGTLLSESRIAPLKKLTPILCHGDKLETDRILDASDVFGLREFLERTSDKLSWANMDSVSQLWQFVKFTSDEQLSEAACALGWKARIIVNLNTKKKELEERLSARAESSGRNSRKEDEDLTGAAFISLLVKSKYVEAGELLNANLTQGTVGEWDSEMMARTYSKATSDVPRALIVLAICGAVDFKREYVETLTDFISQTLASGWHGEALGSSVGGAGIVILSHSSVRSIATRCLHKLSECNYGTNKFIRLVVECFDSRWPEAVAFARSAMRHLESIDEDGIGFCLSLVAGTNQRRAWAALSILAKALRDKDLITMAILPCLYEREYALYGQTVRDRAAETLLQLVA
jgi:hypothetical protein